MQHPFAGILPLKDRPPQEPQLIAGADGERPSSRRTFFAKSLGVAAGAAALLASRWSSAQQIAGHGFRSQVNNVAAPSAVTGPVTTVTPGEEGGDPRRATTYAIGEEGGWTQLPSGVITTVAPFEEGGLSLPAGFRAPSVQNFQRFSPPPRRR
jgi:hypothetical protein